MRKVTVAAVQMACSADREETLLKAEKLVREAAAAGANVILLQELFETPYFCQTHRFDRLYLCTAMEENPAVRRMRELARELGVVLPVSFYEKAGSTAFNTAAMIDADGTILGKYRKSHIPDGVPYAEKFYFTPGDTGFRVWPTRFGQMGVGICWDQWFPEAARCMALMGAELLLYPTAIGSEPMLQVDSMPHWCRVMQGHAAANLVPVIAANRVGTERQDESELTFYGSSFITDETGEILAQADRESEGFVTVQLDIALLGRGERDRIAVYAGKIRLIEVRIAGQETGIAAGNQHAQIEEKIPDAALFIFCGVERIQKVVIDHELVVVHACTSQKRAGKAAAPFRNRGQSPARRSIRAVRSSEHPAARKSPGAFA